MRPASGQAFHATCRGSNIERRQLAYLIQSIARGRENRTASRSYRKAVGQADGSESRPQRRSIRIVRYRRESLVPAVRKNLVATMVRIRWSFLSHPHAIKHPNWSAISWLEKPSSLSNATVFKAPSWSWSSNPLTPLVHIDGQFRCGFVAQDADRWQPGRPSSCRSSRPIRPCTRLRLASGGARGGAVASALRAVITTSNFQRSSRSSRWVNRPSTAPRQRL